VISLHRIAQAIDPTTVKKNNHWTYRCS